MSEFNPLVVDDTDVSDAAEDLDCRFVAAASPTGAGSSHEDVQQLRRRIDAIG